MINIKIKRINNLPEYTKDGDSGMDIRANIEKTIELKKYSRCLIPTGIFIEIPENYEIQIRPRSGLAIKNGITVLNSPGTIDSNYRGEIQIILINTSNESFYINPGDRIAQIVLTKVEKIKWEISENLSITNRGSSGFGDSGKN